MTSTLFLARGHIAMFERFTDRARKVMQLANQEAQRFNHEYIGTEHILLGLVKEGSGTAAKALRSLDVDLRKIRLEIEKIVQSGPGSVTMGKLPPTPRAKKVIEYAIEEARTLNHNYVGTEHLLLGLMREEEGVAAIILKNLGLTAERVREEILSVLAEVEPVAPKDPYAGLSDLPEKALRLLMELDARIAELTLKKEDAVAEQDFAKAARLRDRVDKLKRKRDRSVNRRRDHGRGSSRVRASGPEGITGYNRFTDRSRKVMQLANQEAERYNHEYIGTEHILLGLIVEGQGVGANVLKNLDAGLDKVRSEIEQIIRPGQGTATMSKHPHTPRAKKVVEYAIDEARALGHNHVGTEHLLLGLLREEEGVAAQVLMNLGLKLKEVRQEVLQILGVDQQEAGPIENSVPSRKAEAYDIYIPLHHQDGTAVERGIIDNLKRRLVDKFGDGFVQHGRVEGMLPSANVNLRGRVLVFQVVSPDPRSAREFLRQVKKDLSPVLRQQGPLILAKSVEML